MVSPPQIEKCGDKAKRISAAGQQKISATEQKFSRRAEPQTETTFPFGRFLTSTTFFYLDNNLKFYDSIDLKNKRLSKRRRSAQPYQREIVLK
jgi:hypothetical protein